MVLLLIEIEDVEPTIAKEVLEDFIVSQKGWKLKRMGELV